MLISIGTLSLICEPFLEGLRVEESQEIFSELPGDFFRNENSSAYNGNKPVYVYISLFPSTDSHVLDSYGKIVERDEVNNVVVARVRTDFLEELSSFEEVRMVRDVLPPFLRKGSMKEEEALNISSIELNYSDNVSGAGVRVGIISDGVSLLSDVRVTGNYPSDARILAAGSGKEGTAMLEVVHGIAPEAELYFHEAGQSHLEFNRAVDALVEAGCTVICDDIGWPDEPFFEDGIVASHIREVIENNDILYVSAAGNDANRHYQGMFFDDGSGRHDFSSGVSSSKNLYVSIPPNGSVKIIFQWSDPWQASENDYDLYLLDSRTKKELACSENLQDGTASPLEFIIYENRGLLPLEGLIEVKKRSGVPKVLELYIYPDSSVEVRPENLVREDSIFGHPAVPEVVCVGAVNSEIPDKGKIEPFSSRGPVSIYFPSYELRSKTDICAPDNLKVTGKEGKKVVFSGTSASAPYIAGLAALIRCAYPEKTEAEIREMLYSTAFDLGEPGYDYTYGHGSADARKICLNGSGEKITICFESLDSESRDSESLGYGSKPVFAFQEPLMIFGAWIRGSCKDAQIQKIEEKFS